MNFPVCSLFVRLYLVAVGKSLPSFLLLQKPGLLGDPPAMVVQTAVGMGSALPLKAELGHHGEAHKSK